MGKLLIDYNQIILANIHVGLGKYGDEITFDMIRHLFLYNLKTLKTKFGKDYSEVILCCDGSYSWRRKEFPYYKYKRRESRADSPLDWNMIFDSIVRLRDELAEYFPYRVIHLEAAEGDDCIAVISKYLQTNELEQYGLDVETQKVMIVSSDHDYIQLQVWPNIDQYSSIQKKFVRRNDPQEFLLEHIIKAGDDGIPNIYSDDDTYATGKRSVTMTAKRVEEARQAILTDTMTDDFRRNYKRNKMLIDLMNEIPDYVSDEIIKQYKEQSNKSRSKMMDYFIKNKLKNLMDDISKF